MATKLEIFQKLLYKKHDLVKCIFSTLIFQTTITMLVVIYSNSLQINQLFKHSLFSTFIILLLLNIVLIVAMTKQNIAFSTRFIIFILFSILQGIIISISTMYIKKEIIISAMLSTISIFTIFLVAGMLLVYYNINLSWMNVYLIIALLGLLIWIIISSISPLKNNGRTGIMTAGLILFSIFILYDTNRILLKYNNINIDCIRGALDYYLDILNIFSFSLDSR